MIISAACCQIAPFYTCVGNFGKEDKEDLIIKGAVVENAMFLPSSQKRDVGFSIEFIELRTSILVLIFIFIIREISAL